MNSFQPALTRRPVSILTINGGSSSIKFAVFTTGETLSRCWCGAIDRIGLIKATLELSHISTGQQVHRSFSQLDYASATVCLIENLEEHAASRQTTREPATLRQAWYSAVWISRAVVRLPDARACSPR